MLLDIVFPFAFGYVDTCKGFQDDAVLTDIHALYTDVVNLSMPTNYSTGWSKDDMDAIMSLFGHLRHISVGCSVHSVKMSSTLCIFIFLTISLMI